MLVLTRKIEESIMIDGRIRVTVMALKGGKVRLGIAAPDSVRIDREEVYARRATLAADVCILVPLPAALDVAPANGQDGSPS